MLSLWYCIYSRSGYYNQLWWCIVGQKGRVGGGSCKGGEGMLCSISCYTYRTSWGRGFVRMTPQWECQLSHETCSVIDWWTKKQRTNLQDKRLPLKMSVRQNLKTLPHTATWDFSVRGFYSVCLKEGKEKTILFNLTLTFDLMPLDCLEAADCSFFMKSGLLFDFMISKNTMNVGHYYQ